MQRSLLWPAGLEPCERCNGQSGADRCRLCKGTGWVTDPHTTEIPF